MAARRTNFTSKSDLQSEGEFIHDEVSTMLVPYQSRHSGASVDLCNNHRSIAEVKARGRWGSEKSMMRYNRAAKLAAGMKVFDQKQLAFFAAAERQLEALLFGRTAPESLRLP